MINSNHIKFHSLTKEEILEHFHTNERTGLSIQEVELRQKQYGFNILKVGKQQSSFVRFLLQFHQPLIYILIGASAITAFFHEWVDSGVIFTVVIFNAFVGYLQEARALKAIDALKKMMSLEAICLREGLRTKISAEEVVVGDIIFLQSGDKVPADMRIIQSRELQIDESTLTGESLPVEKSDLLLDEQTLLSERRNTVYSSTLVTYGTCTGCVVGTGQNTEIGEISTLIENTKLLETPLTRKINQFSHTLLYVILLMAGLTFLIGILRGAHWFEMFMAAVALAVGAIPEGLPAAVTIMLAIGVSRMAKHNAIIRKLPAVETLGCTTVICSDKTGTLTQNQMTVQEILAGDESYTLKGSGYNPTGEIQSTSTETCSQPLENQALTECLKSGYLCNDSVLVEAEGRWKVEGDPTEGALLASALKSSVGNDLEEIRKLRIDTIPFESQHHYMAALYPPTNSLDCNLIYLKGSVESILSRCNKMMKADGSCIELDSDRVHTYLKEMASKGLRVLAFAYKKINTPQTSIAHLDVENECVFLGLQGMMDPPRPEVLTAIQACFQAGIQVKMITGDHAITGAAIAKQIGLIEKNHENIMDLVITGKDIENMKESDLAIRVESATVFARVTPAQKLKLVEVFQSLGHVVAMTGDGVNDAPALRRADIGVAMGITGTEVSKESADMILTDDDFSSIKDAVEEGRGVFDNLIKFITWTLPTNLGEGLVIMLAVIFGFDLPILPVQILWINMTTALFLGLTLTFEPKELDIMSKLPRSSKMGILTRPLVERMIVVACIMLGASFGLFYGLQKMGANIEQARTVAVNVFVVIEVFYLFNCRSLTKPLSEIGYFTNKWPIIGAVIMLILQLLFTYNPLMNKLFHTAPISFISWIYVSSAGVFVYIIVAIEKKMRYKRIKQDRYAC